MNKSTRTAAAALLGWSFLTGIGLTLRAQTDTPITISNGSLHIVSAVPWAQFKTHGNVKTHPNAKGSVPTIDVILDNNKQSLNIGGQACQVSVQYGTTVLKIGSGSKGKGLTVATDFPSFKPGSDGNHLDHVNPNQAISRIAITKGGNSIYQGSPTGLVQIVIHYHE